MDNQKIIENSLLKILSQNGFPDPSKMTQRDFEHISIDIENRTGVMLSSTTIKRLSHGEFSRLPQVATLNAIARYFGFTNWQEYKVSEESVCEKTTLNPEATKVVAPHKKLPRFALALLVIPVLAIVFFMSKEKKRFR